MTSVVQRWRQRRESYRPAGEPIRPASFGVEVLDHAAARSFVCAHHYSGSFPASRLSVGLFRSCGAHRAADLVGVATFSVGVQPAAIPKWTGRPPAEGVELGRFVLLDEVPANGETWFLRRAFGVLSATLPDVSAVLAYSDPAPRQTIEGRLLTPGHVGTIYQAFNGRYVGRGSPRTLWIDPSGRAVSHRSLSKIRLGERGAGPAADALVAAGAPRRRLDEDPSAWVQRALVEGGFRRLSHPGCLAYVWPVGRNARQAVRSLPPSAGCYPKRVEVG